MLACAVLCHTTWLDPKIEMKTVCERQVWPGFFYRSSNGDEIDELEWLSSLHEEELEALLKSVFQKKRRGPPKTRWPYTENIQHNFQISHCVPLLVYRPQIPTHFNFTHNVASRIQLMVGVVWLDTSPRHHPRAGGPRAVSRSWAGIQPYRVDHWVVS